MSYTTILITLHQVHANEIFGGSVVKDHEFRKTPPKTKFPVRAIMYVTGDADSNVPKAGKKVVGEFMMGEVDGPKELWGFPLPISNVIRYKEPIPWKMVKNAIKEGPRPQMNFVYIRPEQKGHQDFLDLLEPYRREGIPVH